MIVKYKALNVTSEEPRLLEEYREFEDIFTALAEGVLPEYRPFDYKINTIEGTKPTFKPIY
jgi:hypothetical protein